MLICEEGREPGFQRRARVLPLLPQPGTAGDGTVEPRALPGRGGICTARKSTPRNPETTEPQTPELPNEREKNQSLPCHKNAVLVGLWPVTRRRTEHPQASLLGCVTSGVGRGKGGWGGETGWSRGSTEPACRRLRPQLFNFFTNKCEFFSL